MIILFQVFYCFMQRNFKIILLTFQYSSRPPVTMILFPNPTEQWPATEKGKFSFFHCLSAVLRLMVSIVFLFGYPPMAKILLEIAVNDKPLRFEIKENPSDGNSLVLELRKIRQTENPSF